MEYRQPLYVQPKFVRDGEVVFYLNKKLVEKNDEIALGLRLICLREEFGSVYSTLAGSYFDEMMKDSGVMIAPFTPTASIFPDKTFPGDIDLLIIPYERGELVLSRTIAIELKVIRAKYLKQGKSPNDYGFSQASGLLGLGFPYVAVGHLIISDKSPKEAWRETSIATVISAADGRISPLETIQMDLMPLDLLNRAEGRLYSNAPNDILGLFAKYISASADGGHWFPLGREALFNPKCNQDTLNKIAKYYYENHDNFLMTPRFH